LNRRTFLGTLTGGLLAAPLAAVAQQAAKVYRIGMLETRSATLNAANVDAFRAGMRELGYTQGQNLEIVYWSADGRDEQFPRLASELVRLKVNLILTRGTPATLAAKSATRTIPVVMTAVGDPVVTGLVASLGHPGGNVTGLSLVNVEIFAKRVQLLRELLPGLARIAGLFNMGITLLSYFNGNRWRRQRDLSASHRNFSTCDAQRICRGPSRRRRRSVPTRSSWP
jgi:putative ABC transport system substrate-binding protein